jgi:hypothetical protein
MLQRTSDSFILARLDEQIQRAHAQLARAERELKEDQIELPKRQQAQQTARAEHTAAKERLAELQVKASGVATREIARQLTQRERQVEDAAQRERSAWESVMHTHEGVAYWQGQIRESEQLVRRLEGRRGGAHLRELEGSVIVEASAERLIVELPAGGFRSVRPVSASGEQLSFGGILPLLGSDDPYEGFVGVTITEATSTERKGERTSELQLADHRFTGYMHAAGDEADGDFLVEEATWSAPAPKARRDEPDHYTEREHGHEGNVVSGLYARRVNGELQLLSVYNHRKIAYTDDEAMRAQLLYADSHAVAYGEERMDVYPDELGELIELPEPLHHSYALSMLEAVREGDYERALQLATSNINYEEIDWGFGDAWGRWRYADEDADRQLHELRAMRAQVMQRMGIAHLDRTWKWT